MEFYVVLVLAMTLACVAGVLYFYVMFLEARNRQVARHVGELERENEALREAVRRAEAVAAGVAMGGDAEAEDEAEEEEDDAEAWPDVIEDGEGKGYPLK